MGTSKGDAALVATLLVELWEYAVGFFEAGLLGCRGHCRWKDGSCDSTENESSDELSC